MEEKGLGRQTVLATDRFSQPYKKRVNARVSAPIQPLRLMPLIARRVGSDESRLIKAAREGSPDALETLVRSYWPGAYAVALGVIGSPAAAEDVAQEAMLAAIDRLHSFDLKRPFRPWFHRITANKAIDYVRSHKHEAEARRAEPDQLAAGRRTSESGLSTEMRTALLSLDPLSRSIVVLRHVGGYSSKEIGRIVDQSPNTVRSTLSRSLERLKAELAEPLTTEVRQ